MPDVALQSSFEYLFSFFESRSRLHAGQYDRDVRRPDVFATIARAHGVLPKQESTIVVTGSKGKGSCARLTAAYLQRQGCRVGLVLTPEERTHLDRIRINDASIDALAFIRLLDTFKSDLDSAMKWAGDLFYHPPTAIFLLVALKHFQEKQVDYVVIEGGRGAQFDEIGQINAAVGVVTSLLPEHVARLGPTLREISIDKFSLAGSCTTVVCSEQAWQQARRHAPELQLQSVVRVVAPPVHSDNQPAWAGVADALARATVMRMGRWQVIQMIDSQLLPSCQIIDAAHSPYLKSNQRIMLDGAVSADCLDLRYIQSGACMPGAFVLGLTTDKDLTSIVNLLHRHFSQPLYFFKPLSKSGHVAAPSEITEWSGSFDVSEGLDETSRHVLLETLSHHSRLYVIGVQVFLRSVRNALSA